MKSECSWIKSQNHLLSLMSSDKAFFWDNHCVEAAIDQNAIMWLITIDTLSRFQSKMRIIIQTTWCLAHRKQSMSSSYLWFPVFFPSTPGERWTELIWVPLSVVTCKAQKDPEHGSLVCSHLFGNFSYNSSCSVSCERGYLPNSMETTLCTSSGEWSAPTPSCSGKSFSECTQSFLAHPSLPGFNPTSNIFESMPKVFFIVVFSKMNSLRQYIRHVWHLLSWQRLFKWVFLSLWWLLS
jgi:hypothetical protein